MKIPTDAKPTDVPWVVKGKQKIPLIPLDEPIPKEPRAEAWRVARGMAMLRITWPRRIGRPQGALEKAFRGRAYGLERIADAVGGQEWALPLTSPVFFSEGPHDDARWRVSVTTWWAEPLGWRNNYDAEEDARLKRDPRSFTNVVELELAAPWEAVTGMGAPALFPSSFAYAHPLAGPLTLPDVEVRRQGG